MGQTACRGESCKGEASKEDGDEIDFDLKRTKSLPDAASPVDRRSVTGQASMNTFSLNFLLTNQRGRPKRFILVRHGESQANVDRTITQTVPDNALHLTEKGRQQALECGEMLKGVIGDETVKFIVSPYTRTRETLNGIAAAFGGVKKCCWIEEPRLREMDYGNFDKPDMEKLHEEKKTFGAFFYRFPEGEAPSDVYDRASSFLETLYRMWEHPKEDNYVVVAHGTMILVFMMRFFQLKVDQYYSLASLKNCECIVLEKNSQNWYENCYSVVAGQEPHEGLRRVDCPPGQRSDIWDPMDKEAPPNGLAASNSNGHALPVLSPKGLNGMAKCP
eukprot:TRINITY_DN64851_c0_g1_i1.p1 TRINITY_DN64851_c0_g1~~TRINITY_DN64851_c0_g1_i1.p1  ORF type:complete len:332 (-),score=70.50 TRINITY_DN64851_c0_g1_i1:153-1148(-)